MPQSRSMVFSQIWQMMPWGASDPIVPESWFMSLIGPGDVLPRADNAYHSLAGVQPAGISWQVGYQSCHTQPPQWQQVNASNSMKIAVIAWLCTFSFLAHLNSKRYIELSFFPFSHRTTHEIGAIWGIVGLSLRLNSSIINLITL